MIERNAEELVGQWIIQSGRVVADEVEREIDERIRSKLQLVSTSEDGWSSIYVDKISGTFWELTYIDSSAHGGGPRRLRKIESP